MAKIIDLMHYVRVASGTGFAFVLFGMGGLILNGVILLIGWIPVPSPETKAWGMQKVVHYGRIGVAVMVPLYQVAQMHLPAIITLTQL